MFGGDPRNAGYVADQRVGGDPDVAWDSPVAIEEGDILSTPLIDGRDVFVGSWNAVYAIDRDSGEPRWTRERPYNAGFHSPALADGVVCFAELGVDGGAVSAVRRSDGREAWRRKITPKTSLTAADGRVYVRSSGTDTDRLYGLDAATGRTDWAVDVGSDLLTVAPAPAVGDGVLCTVGPRLDAGAAGSSSGSGSGGAVALHGRDPTDGSVRFRYGTGTGIEPGAAPAIAGDTVYVGTADGVAAVALGSGEERWRVDVGSGVRVSPATDGDAVCVLDDGGTLRALDAATGEPRWHRGIGMRTDRLRSHPTLTDDAVLVGGNRLATFARGDGDAGSRWTFDLRDAASSAFAAPAVAGGTVVVACCHKSEPVQNYDNSVYALR